MDKIDFISLDQNSLICHCFQLTNDKGKSIQLIPAVHFGKKQYFKEIMELIGDNICLYENIQLISYENTKVITSLDEMIENYDTDARDFYNTYEKYIKRLSKKAYSREFRKFRKILKKVFPELHPNITQIFDICEKSLFGVQNMSLLQAVLAQLAGLSFQIFEIDYISDIPNRVNWIHADYHSTDTPQKEEVIGYFKNFTPDHMINLRKNMSLIYSTFYTIIQLTALPLHERKANLANIMLGSFKLPESDFENTISDYLLQNRNDILMDAIETEIETHNNIFVLYGAFHMIAIAQNLIQKGFKITSSQDLVVFDLNS